MEISERIKKRQEEYVNAFNQEKQWHDRALELKGQCLELAALQKEEALGKEEVKTEELKTDVPDAAKQS